jgi:lipopolysaccharide/colanic/teichoic acid biosynthesis glycosyltransferase
VRIKKDGLLFRIFKFRTMVNNADKSGITSIKSDNMHITQYNKTNIKIKSLLNKIDRMPFLYLIIPVS